MKKPWIIIIVSIVLTFIIPGLIYLFVYWGLFGHLQNKEELLKFKNVTASVVLSVEGEPIGKFYAENRTNVSYSQIPAHLIEALIATEDARYFEHDGVDTRSLFRVLFKTILLSDRDSGGGSTITQQLVKNMYGRKNDGSFSILINKIKEAILASRLEKAFSKEEILNLYLNTIAFGENVYGIEAASGRYFNKKVENLKVEESAVLVGMLKANTYYNPRLYPENARNRRNVVLKQMEKYKYLIPAEADSLCKLPLIQDYAKPESGGPADYFLVHVRKEAEKIMEEIYSVTEKRWNIEQDGLIITTTLNLELQKHALKSFHDHLSVMQNKLNEQYRSASGKRSLEKITENELTRQNLKKRSEEIISQAIFNWNGTYLDSISVTDSLKYSLTLLHAGLLVLDPATGAVKVWVGGIDFKTQPYDQIYARRQLASVFKPFIFAVALEEGMEPCQYLDNDSVILSGFNDWSPENYDHSFGGKYSLAGALAQSMNIPTFSLFLNISFDDLDSLWRKMGFSSSLENTPSLALGVSEANIREVAVAYSSFANGGYRISSQMIVSIRSPDGTLIYQNDFPEAAKRIMTERTSTLISAILQKAVREGTGASLYRIMGVTIPMAGKTGTSQNYADAWFAAFNPKLVIVSRVGASSPAIHFNNGSNGSGSALALPLVAITLKKAISDPELMREINTPFPDLPPGLRGALDCPDFREKNLFEKLQDLFKRDELIFDKKGPETEKRKKSFLERIFKR